MVGVKETLHQRYQDTTEQYYRNMTEAEEATAKYATSCKLFVGGLSAHTTTEALRSHFCRFGRLTDAVVMSKNGRPRGFGFVTYDAPSGAAMALAEPQWLDGRLVDVKRAVPGERPQDRSSNKIFVGGLPQDVGTDDLKAYFNAYGTVCDAVVMLDHRTNRSRGFGFVRFSNGGHGSAAAKAVLTDFASHRLAGKWVEVKLATPAALLQEFGPMSDKGASPTSMAFLEQQMGMYFGTMDGPMSGWENSNCAASQGRTRGRRGRRKQRSELNEDVQDEQDDASYAASSSGSPNAMHGEIGRELVPWTSQPSELADMLEEVDDKRAIPRPRRRTFGLGAGESSENDPARANRAAPGRHGNPGVISSPMKVHCVGTSQEELFEGFTREDFLSLEVRPWLSAC